MAFNLILKTGSFRAPLYRLSDSASQSVLQLDPGGNLMNLYGQADYKRGHPRIHPGSGKKKV